MEKLDRMSKKLTHIDTKGEVRMVDVSDKPIQERMAVARGEVRIAPATIKLIRGDKIAKGNVLATARIAAIQVAKRTADLIPMCHPLAINHCEVEFDFPKSGNTIVITSTVKVNGQTGVEMEALTAVNLAALTIYDMCKAVDNKMRITNVKLISKTKK